MAEAVVVRWFPANGWASRVVAAASVLRPATSALAAEVGGVECAVDFLRRAQARRLEGWRSEDRQAQCPPTWYPLLAAEAGVG
eukprot:3433789-Lingulodinium_polyedra.AAC.1